MLTPLMQKQVTKGFNRYRIITADNYGVFLKDNEIVVRDENGDDLMHYNGRGKILEDVIYANGYIIFVEASDSWGYDVNYFSIENGRKKTIDTFDEFDRLIKLEDGRIFIDSLNSDDMYVIFDPYKLTTEAVADFLPTKEKLDIVYDTNH